MEYKTVEYKTVEYKHKPGLGANPGLCLCALFEPNTAQPVIFCVGIGLALGDRRPEFTLNPRRQRREVISRHGKFSKATNLVAVGLVAIIVEDNRHRFVEPLVEGIGDLLHIFNLWPRRNDITHPMKAALTWIGDGVG